MRPEDIPERETTFAIPPIWVVVPKHNPGHIVGGRSFETDTAATAWISAAGRDDEWQRSYVVTRGTWQHREQVAPERDLRYPIWQNESWWEEGPAIIRDLHMPRVSTVDRTMLAYFQSPEKACLNIRTRIKPGRYLGKFFPDMPEAERARMAKWQETGMRETLYNDETKYPMHFATTREDIRTVYNNGPGSCMDGSHRWQDNSYTNNLHPCEVYAAGDLAIAYFKALPGESPDYIARAICWPEKKVFGRVYPTPTGQDTTDIQDAMRNRFLAMGWREDARSGFNGAKLLKIQIKAGWLMPYLDWGYGVDNAGEHWIVQRDGDRTADSTSGYISASSFLDDDDDDDDLVTCEGCNERVESTHTVYTNAVMMRDQSWCECCRDNDAFYCNGEQEYFADGVTNVEVDGETYTLRYAENNFVRCDYTGDWTSGETVEMANGQTWSSDAFDDNGFECVITGDNHPNTNRHPAYDGDFEFSNTCTDAMILKWFEDHRYTDEAAELRAIIEADEAQMTSIQDERQPALF